MKLTIQHGTYRKRSAIGIKQLNKSLLILVAAVFIPYISYCQHGGLSSIEPEELNNSEYSFGDYKFQNENPEYFNNYIYLEVWGHSWFSLNYFRFLQSPNMLIGGGIGGNLDARNFTLADGGGETIHFFLEKQFNISKKFHSGFGIGATHDFSGPYGKFVDPLYLKVSINRYSISLAEDKLYYGVSLYYQKWDTWKIRPGARLGISF